MGKIIYLAVISIIFSCSNTKKYKTEESISFKEIELYNESSEGGNLKIGFIKEPLEIKSMDIILYGDLGKVNLNYSFLENEKVLYNEVNYFYDKPFYQKNSKIKDSTVISCELIKNNILKFKIDPIQNGLDIKKVKENIISNREKYLTYWTKMKNNNID